MLLGFCNKRGQNKAFSTSFKQRFYTVTRFMFFKKIFFFAIYIVFFAPPHTKCIKQYIRAFKSFHTFYDGLQCLFYLPQKTCDAFAFCGLFVCEKSHYLLQ